MYEAKTRLSQLVAEVEQGTEILLTRHGEPVARIVRPLPQGGLGALGVWKGYTIAEGWDRWTEQDESDWFGS